MNVLFGFSWYANINVFSEHFGKDRIFFWSHRCFTVAEFYSFLRILGDFEMPSNLHWVGVHARCSFVRLKLFVSIDRWLQKILRIRNIKFTYKYLSWWKYFSEIIFHFLIFWEILGDFSDFFRKFSIVSENYRIKNLIFKEKRRNFRFLTNYKKVSHFLQISRISSETGEIEKLKILEKSQKT